MFEGSENIKDKRLTSIVNDFDTFTTTPGESIALASNRYQIVVNNMTAHRIIRVPLEYNLKFINSLRKGCRNVESCLQGNGSNIAQTLRELFGGPLALVSCVNPLIPNLFMSDPFGTIPHVSPVQPTFPMSPTPPIPNNSENHDLDPVESELRFR